MDKKTKRLIGLIGSLIVCLFGVYRLVVEVPAPENSLIIPIVFAITGLIGVIANVFELRKSYK
ncbi:hypothetical protein [Niallia sp. Krafla_26]|uniref:hypothetical protein n=1 Tax=Niallia sp. Krafla_26 TaxID=3064703 RepID=UPI003D17AA7C